MKWRVILATSLAGLLFFSVAQAEDEVDEDKSGFFVSASLGATFFRSPEVRDRGPNSFELYSGPYTVESPNLVVGGALGLSTRYLDHRISYDYRSSDQKLSGAEFRVFTVMYQPTAKVPLSVLGASPDGFFGRSWVYLGFGVGAAQGKTSLSGEFYLPAPPFPEQRVPLIAHVDGWTFAYQAAVGVVFPITDQLGLEVGYRYVGSTDFQVVPAATVEENAPPVQLGDWALSYGTNELTIGIRFEFQ